jgi:hypothetical protein
MRNTKSNSRSKASKSKGSVLRHVQNFSLTQLLVFVLIFGAIGGYVIYKSLAAPAKNTSSISWNRYFENIITVMDTTEPDGHPPINTTGCAWNDEDEIMNLGRGDITGSTSDTICMVADLASNPTDYPKNIIYKVYAPSNSALDVTLSNDAGNSWASPPSVLAGNQRLWQMCVADPVALNAGINTPSELTYWPEIPGTNGGHGKIVNYTLHITSLKGTTHKVSASYEVGFTAFGSTYPYIQQSNPVPCTR